ncbi:MAG: L,D-transpeptidase family protein [Hellea sp.]|nr:L,D-transpeptidase family protein [Hellea sp.]
MSIIVNCAEKTISFNGKTYSCRIGRGGYIDGSKGREGDEKTPLGDYVIRFGFYRPDRLSAPLPTALNMIALTADDGWCDGANDPAYNRFVKTSNPGSHEKLWRSDGAYDVVLVISHNDSPPEPNCGSAVFIHIAQPDDRETLGCVALTPDVMVKLLAVVYPEIMIRIKA